MDVRTATMEDAKRLFDWRNDPVTRQMSKNSEPVTWDYHLDWLRKRLALADPRLYIVEEDGVAVATYRIDGANEISYTVAPEFRLRGIASTLLVEALKRHGPLTAHIFRDNSGSIKAASQANVDIIHLNRT